MAFKNCWKQVLLERGFYTLPSRSPRQLLRLPHHTENLSKTWLTWQHPTVYPVHSKTSSQWGNISATSHILLRNKTVFSSFCYFTMVNWICVVKVYCQYIGNRSCNMSSYTHTIVVCMGAFCGSEKIFSLI